MQNYYETLKITPNATQKDIREAYLKLSKEMHPDTSKKSNHADFVKVLEAYQVLSKEYTRKEYDMRSRNHVPNGQRVTTVYYDDASFYSGRTAHQTMQGSNFPGNNYYGIKGVRRVSNVTIGLLCIVLSAIGLSIQVAAVNNSYTFKRDELLERSSKIQATYRKIRADAMAKQSDERIAEVERKLESKNVETGVSFKS